MTSIATLYRPAAGLLLPALLLAMFAALIVAQAGLPVPSEAGIGPATTIIGPRAFPFRDAGDFQRGGVPVDAPLVTRAVSQSLEIMTYQVGVFDYGRCVDAGGCEPAQPRRKVGGNVPVTGVNFTDATDYATWLSAETGETWRLPTVEEWAFAAGSRAAGHGVGVATDGANPAERWLAFYEREAALGAAASAKPEPLGSFGVNEFGVADLGGSVWEWTATCNSRTQIDAAGGVLTHIEACGVRILEGRHRAPMSSFVRDGRSGGCSVDAPPDNLGFRLVRERHWLAALVEPVAALFR